MHPGVIRTNDAATVLRECFDAALGAVEPAIAMRRALASGVTGDRCWIIAVGKAAPGMAQGLLAGLDSHGRTCAGGIVVGAEVGVGRVGPLVALSGDHPVPAARSAHAAAAVGHLLESILPGAVVHVALSGGTSSLLAAPLPGLSAIDVADTFSTLLTSGLDIEAMNAVRKRLTRWSAGRLALALPDRTIHLWLISDVPGDDVGSIGSGPCTGDPWTSPEVAQVLQRSNIWQRLSPRVQQAITRETAKPDDPGLAAVVTHLVATNQIALDAAAAHATSLGLQLRMMAPGLNGDAATMGRTIAAACRVAPPDTLLLWGGETTVATHGAPGVGGRSQELALAAAAALDAAPEDVTILAAGTDGRDGPTDAAGAWVDNRTWASIAATGRQPARDLADHNAYPALASVEALVRTGPTGTNVSDVVLALTASRPGAP